MLASKVISVDACGEDRRELAQDVNQIRAPLGEDEPWLGCSDARSRVVWFDPAGTEAAIPVPGVTACPERLAGNSLIDVTDGVLTGRSDLVRIELGTDGAATTSVLLEDCLAWRWGRTAPPSSASVVGLAVGGFLVDIELNTGIQTTLRNGVVDFDVADDGRYVVWSPDANSAGKGTWFLWDRVSGEEQQLGIDAWDGVVVELHDRSVDAVWTPEIPPGGAYPPEDSATQIVLLPEGVSFIHDWLWRTSATLEDGTRAFVESPSLDSYLLDAGSTTPRQVDVGNAAAWWTADDAFWVLSWERPPLASDLPRVDILALDASDLLPRVAVPDVYLPVRLSDGRWLTTRDRGDSEYGTLTLIDAEGGAHDLDDGVHRAMVALNAEKRSEPPSVDHEVAYLVHGDRRGVWLADLTPR